VEGGVDYRRRNGEVGAKCLHLLETGVGHLCASFLLSLSKRSREIERENVASNNASAFDGCSHRPPALAWVHPGTGNKQRLELKL
jgi:hypothetical protein